MTLSAIITGDRVLSLCEWEGPAATRSVGYYHIENRGMSSGLCECRYKRFLLWCS